VGVESQHLHVMLKLNCNVTPKAKISNLHVYGLLKFLLELHVAEFAKKNGWIPDLLKKKPKSGESRLLINRELHAILVFL